jgi:hypothetical protein
MSCASIAAASGAGSGLLGAQRSPRVESGAFSPLVMMALALSMGEAAQRRGDGGISVFYWLKYII